ncbi:MAG TPA: uroporphyrinogen decarboxylase family protein [Bellilinea sp.]|nr:uroporphyrinogen decarboxylase family protein [Bellilinea sp.]
MQTNLTEFILGSQTRLAMPVGAYSGLHLTGKSVAGATNDFFIQANAILALYERYHSPFLQTAMDLSVEAETFGAQVRFEEGEIPNVVGRLITNREDKSKLFAPKVGHKRTNVPLSVVSYLKEHTNGKEVFVLGGMIGPFSLVGRLYGVNETLILTYEDPDLLADLLKMAVNFLQRYAETFRGVGADGIIVAEPAAGLLSPASLGRFSMPYVRQMVEALQTPKFSFIYHNCGAKLAHLKEILKDGAAIHHFGKPMDLVVALQQVDDQTILAGNLDPAEVFVGSTSAEVYQQTRELLAATAGHSNFVLSSGCDLPPNMPMENLDAFYRAVSDFNMPS